MIVTTAVVGAQPNIVKAIPGIESIFRLINYSNMGKRLDKFEQF